MKNLIVILALGLMSSMALADTASDMQDIGLITCGSIEEVMKASGVAGTPSAQDLKDLNDMRAPYVQVLVRGNAGLKDLLEQGSKQDTGGFGVMMVCSVLVQQNDFITKHGCVVDLRTGKKVFKNAGLAACQKIVERANQK